MSSLVPVDQRRWLPAPQEGVELCVLHSHGDSREVTALFRMRGGAKLPRHTHPGGEHIFVVEGSVDVDGRLIRAGDYHHTLVDETHEVIAQEDCVLLTVLPKGPA